MARSIKLHKFNLPFYLLLMITVVPFLKIRYNIKAINKELFKTLKPPFILIPNHVALLDAPIVNAFLWHRVHFVMSDGNLRNPLLRFIFINIMSVIPKTKVVSDTTSVRQMIGLAKKKRVICVFAEGRASWDGVTHDIYFSTVKLLKVLKIPVVVPLIRGGYLTKPRWSNFRRCGEMVIDYRQIFDGPELAMMEQQEIFDTLTAAMYHDDYAYQQETGLQYKSKRGAEYLELLLVTCPVCLQTQHMHSHKNLFTCSACGFASEYTSTGTLKPLNNAEQPERTVTEWSNWQSDFIQQKIDTMRQHNSTQPLFTDENVTIKLGYKTDPLAKWIRGTASVYLDRFEFTSPQGRKEIIPMEEICGAQVLKAQVFEFYRNGTLYHFKFPSKRISGYKYMLAVQKIRPQSAELE